ncbi:MAG: hypothetical protein ACAI44_16795, partial [Candidatus Sericytochromatia bacterium]
QPAGHSGRPVEGLRKGPWPAALILASGLRTFIRHPFPLLLLQRSALDWVTGLPAGEGPIKGSDLPAEV